MYKFLRCIRNIRSMICHSNDRKWLQYLQDFCNSKINQFGWCQLILDNYTIIKQYEDCKLETQKRIRSTNITSEVLKAIILDFKQQNPFQFCSEILCSYIKLRYCEIINPSIHTLKKIKNQYQNFIQFLKQCMIIYYNIQQRQLIGEDSFYSLTLTNFIIDRLFSNEEFVQSILKIQKQADKARNDKINFNMQKYQSLQLEQYEVNTLYLLNEKTLNHFGIDEKVIQRPYLQPIQKIKQIIKEKNPHDKLKVIENIMRQIQISIRNFYTTHKLKSSIQIDADNIISILIYIIIQSNQVNLLSHLEIVLNYANPALVSGNCGYCVTSLEACLSYIQKGTIKRGKGLNVSQQELSMWINTQSYFEHLNNHQL